MKMRTFWENERRKLLGQPLIQDNDNQANTAIDAPTAAVLRQADEEINKVKNISVYVVLGEHKVPEGGGQIIDIQPTPNGLDNAIVLLTEAEADIYRNAKEGGYAIGNQIIYENDDRFHRHIRATIGIAYLVDDMFAFWEKHEKYKTCWTRGGIIYNQKTLKPEYHIAEHSIELVYNRELRRVSLNSNLIAFDGYPDSNNPEIVGVASDIGLPMFPNLHTHGLDEDLRKLYVFRTGVRARIQEVAGKKKLVLPEEKWLIEGGSMLIDVIPHIPSSADFNNSKWSDIPNVVVTSKAIWLIHQLNGLTNFSIRINKNLWQNHKY